MKQQFETEQKPMFAAANDKWLAVDLDGTLAEYHGWKGEDHIGDLIPAMAEKIMQRVNDGWKVAIFTARVSGPTSEAVNAERIIWGWLEDNKMAHYISGITAVKQKHFREFWDDRAHFVEPNTGVIRDLEPPVSINLEAASMVQVGGNHYAKYAIQPAYFAFVNKMPFLDANAFKYVMRHRDKNGMEDLRKAKHYLELIAEWEYKEKL